MTFGFAAVATFVKKICLGFSDELQEVDPPLGTSNHGFSISEAGTSSDICFSLERLGLLGVVSSVKVCSSWGGRLYRVGKWASLPF